MNDCHELPRNDKENIDRHKKNICCLNGYVCDMGMSISSYKNNADNDMDTDDHTNVEEGCPFTMKSPNGNIENIPGRQNHR